VFTNILIRSVAQWVIRMSLISTRKSIPKGMFVSNKKASEVVLKCSSNATSIYTHIHKYTYSYIHNTRIHISIHSNVHTHTHTKTFIHIHNTRLHIFAHSNIHTWTDNKVRELATVCLPWQYWTIALVWFDDGDISVFHSCVVVDL